MIAERLKQIRLARGLSLDALVREMGEIVTKQAISKYETSKAQPMKTTAFKSSRLRRTRSSMVSPPLRSMLTAQIAAMKL